MQRDMGVGLIEFIFIPLLSVIVGFDGEGLILTKIESELEKHPSFVVTVR
jgi:hypothetical protein